MFARNEGELASALATLDSDLALACCEIPRGAFYHPKAGHASFIQFVLPDRWAVWQIGQPNYFVCDPKGESA